MNAARDSMRRRWYAMIQRCTNPMNPSWVNYGGRGIKVCGEWLGDFDAFYAFLGDPPEGMTIDRVDNDGDYEPGNVRWATRLEQNNNRRPRSVDPVGGVRNRAKTHCPANHPYDEANTYRRNGARFCRECNRQAQRRYQERKRAAA